MEISSTAQLSIFVPSSEFVSKGQRERERGSEKGEREE